MMPYHPSTARAQETGMEFVNDPQPWYGMLPGEPLSIVDLIANDTLTVEVAAALWWAIERGASFFVAAGPQRAGKTTLATALLAFLPDDAKLYVTSGPDDALALPEQAAPLYLLVNELSDHTSVYLSGEAACRAFAALDGRVKMAGALHADHAAGAVAVMHEDAGIPLDQVARINLVVVVRVRQVGRQVERRVAQVALLRAAGAGVDVVDVARRDGDRDELAFLPPPGGMAALAAWQRVLVSEVDRDLGVRGSLLRELVEHGTRDPEAVAGAVRRFRRSPRGKAPLD